MQKILVTGSEGDVGSALHPQLARRFDAVGFDRRPHDGPLSVVQGDLLNEDDVAAAMEGIDAVVHMAVLLPVPATPAEFVDLNVKATANALQAAVDAGVTRFVYCSTVWVSGHGYTEPYMPIDEDVPCDAICMYGQTKWLGELMTEYYARQHGLETVIIRFCGFNAVPGYDAEGNIDWENADVQAMLLRYLSAGFKLLNPIDLGDAFGKAVEEPNAVGQKFVIGCQTPYTAAEAEELKSDPKAVIDRHEPGTAALFDELDIDLPPVEFYFSHARAQEILGFRNQHSLGDLARLYREWRQG